MKEELKIFLPNKEYWVTQVLILINIVIYILMVVSGVDAMDPSVDDLIVWGGNMDVLFADGEYWRLLTSCFIHIGLIHLIMNMYALLYIGFLLEPIIGHHRFLFAYILTGLVSSLASALWNTHLVSAGASGAIFGMYGIFLVLLLSKRIVQAEARKDMLVSIVIFVGYNLLYGLKGEVDNAGHIGGLLSGMVVGATYYLSLTKSPIHVKMPILQTGLPLVLLALVFLITYHAKKDEASLFIEDADFFNELIDISYRADEEFQSDMNAPLSIRMQEKDAFKMHMDTSIQLLEEYFFEKDNVEPVFHTLYDYFKARVKYLDLYIEYEQSDYDESYEEELLELNSEIETLINTLDEQYLSRE